MRINTCHSCKKQFTKPNNPQRFYKYCSLKCVGENTDRKKKHSLIMKGRTAWNKGDKGLKPWMNITGLNVNGTIPHNKKEDVFIKCKECGKERKIKPCHILTDKFCSHKCYWKNKDMGKSPEAMKIRASKEYKAWRQIVKQRDGNKCVECGSKEKLEVDHIKRFSTHPELRFDIDNGRTLCKSCHVNTPTYGNFRKKEKAA